MPSAPSCGRISWVGVAGSCRRPVVCRGPWRRRGARTALGSSQRPAASGEHPLLLPAPGSWLLVLASGTWQLLAHRVGNTAARAARSSQASSSARRSLVALDSDDRSSRAGNVHVRGRGRVRAMPIPVPIRARARGAATSPKHVLYNVSQGEYEYVYVTRRYEPGSPHQHRAQHAARRARQQKRQVMVTVTVSCRALGWCGRRGSWRESLIEHAWVLRAPKAKG